MRVFAGIAQIGERVALVEVIIVIGSLTGKMIAIGPAGIVEGAVPARDVVLIDVVAGQCQCGVWRDGVVEAQIEVLLRIAGVNHAAHRVIADVAEVFGRDSEKNAEFAADPGFGLESADVAPLAVAAVFIRRGTADIGPLGGFIAKACGFAEGVERPANRVGAIENGTLALDQLKMIDSERIDGAPILDRSATIG